MNIYSPLRYPGGKGKVVDYFKQVFKDNLLYDGVYVEPYAGGASVALALLFDEYASRIVINDVDISIYAFWHSVLYDTESLCRMIRDVPMSVKVWHEQKEIQRKASQHSLLEVGLSTFYLNRTNRSGILKAGIIGGKEQNGHWQMDARFNKIDLIKRIERIADFRDRIQLFNKDAVDLVSEMRQVLPKNTLFYLDPPYYIKGKDLYLNYYTDEDHRKIAREIGHVKHQKWIITYDAVDFIKELYGSFRQNSFKLSYSAGTAKKGEELMVFSENIFVPENELLFSNAI